MAGSAPEGLGRGEQNHKRTDQELEHESSGALVNSAPSMNPCGSHLVPDFNIYMLPFGYTQIS